MAMQSFGLLVLVIGLLAATVQSHLIPYYLFTQTPENEGGYQKEEPVVARLMEPNSQLEAPGEIRGLARGPNAHLQNVLRSLKMLKRNQKRLFFPAFLKMLKRNQKRLFF